MRSLAVACGTLTTFHVPLKGDVTRADLVASTGWYPLVGAAIGVCASLPLLLPFPNAIRAAVALIVWIGLTGALHLDGWADCADAALAPDRGGRDNVVAWRLGILKDPHIGTFGVVGLILLLMMKWAALMVVAPSAPIVAALVARYAIVLIIGRFKPARADGLIASYGGLSDVMTASVMIAAIAGFAAVWSPTVRVVFAIVLGPCAGILLAQWLASRFGGITGDVCGAAVEIAELVALLAFVPVMP